jgi:hypothetical protein
MDAAGLNTGELCGWDIDLVPVLCNSQLYRRLTSMPIPTVKTRDNRLCHKNDTLYRTNANSWDLEIDKKGHIS